MDLTILFNLTYFELEESRDIQMSDLTFKSNQKHRQQLFSIPIRGAIGEMECNYSQEPYVIYRKDIDIDLNSSNIEMQAQADVITNYKVDEFLDYLMCSWLVKDNSASIYNVMQFLPQRDLVSKLTLHFSPSNCKGDRTIVKFSSNEIKSAYDLLIKYYSIIDREANYVKIESNFFLDTLAGTSRSVVNAQQKNFDYNKTNCIERAFHFLFIARTQEYLIYKIAFYMPVLECLFCTDSSEITTKLRYRVAFYIGKDREDRIRIDKLISACYDIRSKFIHGQIYGKDKLKNMTPPILTDYSFQLDEVIRAILTKIILFDSDKFLNDNRDKTLNNLIFNIEGAPIEIKE